LCNILFNDVRKYEILNRFVWLKTGTSDHGYEAFSFHKIRRYSLTPGAREHFKKGPVTWR